MSAYLVSGICHVTLTNKVINYLVSIKNLALYFGGFNNLEVVNNTLFADNTLDRKSS